jgi:hypothetical protein
VLDACRQLKREGFEVTYLEPGADGIVEPAQVEAVLRSDTMLVSLMHVNNEIGIVQDVAARLYLTVPNQVFTSTDPQTVQMRSLMNSVGREVLRAYPWQNLRVEGTISTVDDREQSAVPSDFGYIVNDTMWNRTLNRLIAGPLSPQEWQRELAGPVVTSVEFAYRIMGDTFYITPAPASGHTIYYEYVTKNWCESTGGTGQTAMAADADVSRLDEELITLGVLWRFKHSKGMDFSQEFADFTGRFSILTSHDGGKPTLSLSRPQPRRMNWPNIPDGSYGT